MSLNPSSLTGISNENEFYTDNYFRTTLPDDLDTWVEKAVLADAQESREAWLPASPACVHRRHYTRAASSLQRDFMRPVLNASRLYTSARGKSLGRTMEFLHYVPRIIRPHVLRNALPINRFCVTAWQKFTGQSTGSTLLVE